MPDYAYVARTAAGQRVEGVLAAGTEREALAALAAKELFPTQVKAAAGTVVKAGGARVRPQAMSQFYVQLAALLRSGVPLLRSLEVLGAQATSPAMKQIVSDLHSRVTEGDSLSSAMARHPRAFTDLARGIVRAGSEGGFLEEALERVAKFTDQQAELRSRVLGALAYPIFLACFGVVIVSVLIVFFVPKFEVLFARLRARGELPALTDLLLNGSAALHRYFPWIALAIVAAIAFVRQWLASEAAQRQLDAWRLSFPMAGTIYRNFAIGRFCRVLGTLLAGGVPIVRSLKISAESTGNRLLSEVVEQASESISAGESISTPLARSGRFPPNVIEMIAVAEQSNSLDAVLPQIADSLERETWRRLDLFVRLLEPLMLVILAAAVLLIVIALMLPMLKSATSL
jgi:general secretion pathway protein F/type IV pilus assembly protein PilC